MTAGVEIKDYFRKDGNLISVSLRLKNPREIEIYKKFLATEVKLCSNCGAENEVGDDDLILRIDNPLGNTLGLQIATPIMHCDKCGKEFPLNMLDYTAFPSVVSFIHTLKKRNAELKKEKAEHGKEG